MSRHQHRREHSVNLLVDTALKLFAEKGFEKTSIRSIAQEAGVSLGLLYNYFPGKEQLLAEIFKRGVADIHATFAQQPSGQSPAQGIEQHILQTVKLLKEKKNFWKLLHSIRLQSAVLQQLLNSMQAETAYIESQIKQNLIAAGIPFPDLEAKLLFASIDGMANHYLFQEHYPIDDVATLLIMKYKKQ